MLYKIKEIKTRVLEFEDVESCFEALINQIDRLEKQGYKLEKIEGNVYHFKKDDIEYSIIIRNKENDSIYF